jgi:hypothetical protein
LSSSRLAFEDQLARIFSKKRGFGLCFSLCCRRLLISPILLLFLFDTLLFRTHKIGGWSNPVASAEACWSIAICHWSKEGAREAFGN